MKKKNGVSCTILLGVVIADFHMYQCPKHEIDSSLTLLNIEILALARRIQEQRNGSEQMVIAHMKFKVQ